MSGIPSGSTVRTPPPADPARDYYGRRPNVDDADQLVSYGAGGHRGQAADGTFTETHVAALAQAVCDHRRLSGLGGPLFVGRDATPLAAVAAMTARGVFAANGVRAVAQAGGGVVPSPVVSWAIVTHNRGGTPHLADGIVLGGADDPPGGGVFQYHPPHGGPAGPEVARWVEDRANEYLLRDNAGVRRPPTGGADEAREEDLIGPYVDAIRDVIDVDAIRTAGVVIGVDPRDGAACWESIARAYGLEIEAAGRPSGRVRLTIATDADGGGCRIVAPAGGYLDPDDFLAVAIPYLLGHRPGWPARAAVGLTPAAGRSVDGAVSAADREVAWSPPGFRWFADGLYDGSLCFAGEGPRATFARHDGSTWTTDADGLVMGLLAAEIAARTGKHPAELCHEAAAEIETGGRA